MGITTDANPKSINSVMVMLFKKRLFRSNFSISTCETVLQFNENSRTQFIEGKGYQRIRTVKTLSLKKARSNVKKCCDY